MQEGCQTGKGESGGKLGLRSEGDWGAWTPNGDERTGGKLLNREIGRKRGVSGVGVDCPQPRRIWGQAASSREGTASEADAAPVWAIAASKASSRRTRVKGFWRKVSAST